ncbi:MAG: THxN family PEP-CTERM protein [Gammaproteobacteria bacterium]|nr:THxN family PEP-CTERM protein [Gammaproteobacteria bacterium]
MNRIPLLASLCLVGASMASTANAAFIDQFGFRIESGFTAFQPTGVTASESNTYLTSSSDLIPLQGGGFVQLPFAAADTRLDWGVDGTSGLDIDEQTGSGSFGKAIGNAATNGAAVTVNNITHRNQEVLGNQLLTDATLFTVLFLEPGGMGASVEVPVPALVFEINFVETFNPTIDNQLCGPTSGNCWDIFVLGSNQAGVDVTSGMFSQDFIIDDFVYNLTVFLPDLTALNPTQCAAAGAAAGCYGWTTVEGADTTETVALQISGRPVDVPPALALMGLGLGLLGWRQRRAGA